MAAPLTNEEREHIANLLHQGLTHGEIARRVGRAQRTVSREAQRIGKPPAQDNLARVSRANETRRAVGAEARGEVAAAAKVRALELLGQMQEPVEELVATADGVERCTRAAQPRDQHYRASAFRALWQSVMETVRFDERGEEDLSQVDRWLDDMTGGR